MSDQIFSTDGFLLFIVLFITFFKLMSFFFNRAGLTFADTIKYLISKKKNFSIDFVKEFSSTLSVRQKNVFSLLVSLFIINLVFLFVSEEDEYRSTYFWPIDSGSKLKFDYGILEFLVYAIFPWVVFLINWFLLKGENKPKNT
jgi:hypothetical protein